MRAPLGPFWVFWWVLLLLALMVLFFWTSMWQLNHKALFKLSKAGLSIGHFQTQFSDFENPLGLNHREARLADRVRDMQDENQILRHQLSVSQNQLMSLLSEQGLPDQGKEPIKGQLQRKLKEQEKPCDNKEIAVPNCDVIHISIVSAGFNSSRNVATLVKSILFYRRHPIHLHLLVDSMSKMILRPLFATWAIPKVEVSFYSSDSETESVSWVPNKHYSGIYGLLKLILPKILPQSLKKVIVLDTDVILASDISKLWRIFNDFSAAEALGLVENQSDWYLPGKLWKTHSPWPALGRGFNTGVILMDLEKLRDINWSQLWRLTAEMNLVTEYSTSLADQDIFNAVIRHEPNLVHTLPCTWNLQLSDNTKSETCYLAANFQDLNLIHFNSPKKLNVEMKKFDYFRQHFFTFVQMDGSLLRRDLFQCNQSESFQVETSTQTQENVNCQMFRKAGEMVYRTHLYYIEYGSMAFGPDDVTLVTQLSFDRLHLVEELSTRWPGPISLALYLSDPEADLLFNFVQTSKILSARKNIAYHVVYKDGDFYPINYLRNVAFQNVISSYVFLMDIDFLPQKNCYSTIKDAVAKNIKNNDADFNHGRMTLTALVIPAFESQNYKVESLPNSKAEVIRGIEEGTIFKFRHDVWPQGHAATNYAKWKSATTPYEVKWEPDFEPYVIVPSDLAPKYDNRFVGFGWNKVSHVMEMEAIGFKFVVLPNVFIIHLPHGSSPEITKFRNSKYYRRCLKLLKSEFIDEMKIQYGKEFDSQTK